MNALPRREFLKNVARASAAAAAAALVPGVAFGEGMPSAGDTQQALSWKKAPCRFCGVGCGLLIGIENQRAVAVRGDPEAEVNKGLACVKGYHGIQALYGRDRLRRALVRRGGRLIEVPIAEALDLVARTLTSTIEQHGKNSVAMYGSGQWTIPAGYVAAKLFKGAIGSNNLEADVRLGAASAVAGFQSTFGLDEPMGCYEDIEHADVFVLWNSNMAEMYPVLFSRLLERRRRNPTVRIIDLGTRTTRTSYAADHRALYRPQADLALANAICHELVARGWVDRDFVERHVSFKRGATGIGYGLTSDPPVSEDPADVTFEDYEAFLEEYAPERVQDLTGVPAAQIRWLASLYGDRARKVMSFWGRGVNQHTRGTWLNNLLYNIHLLVGKVASPGNSPFSLSGQASACGSVREVGALAHALPHGVVSNAADRERAAAIWGVPAANIDPTPGLDAVSLFRALERGAVRFLWIQGSNPMVTLPNLGRYRAAARRPGAFLVVSDAYPTPTTDVADVVLPSALWIEQEGLYGNSERRTQHFEQMVQPPGDAMSDAWQLIEVARRAGYGSLFPAEQARHVEEIWNEYARFHDLPDHRMASLNELKRRPGILWPFVEGRETRWRYNTAHDPAADSGFGEFDFYGKPDHRAWIWLRPYEPPAEAPDREYPFWLSTGGVLEHVNGGSLTRRIPVLHRAVPRAYLEIHREDADALRIRNGENVRLVTRRGALVIPIRIDFRAQPPRGHLFAPYFDESLPVNQLTLDAVCPISRQPDYRKCAARIERLSRPDA